jgi:8-oxo-dGTP pyrophosphatase MutT (NUDIX family)
VKSLSSKIVYQNRWMTVREDAIERADGTHGIYGIVEKPDFAVIAAIQNEDVYLVQQYRYPVKARFWELPQGSWASGTGSATDLARTELREETGLTAQEMQHIAHLHNAYGYSNQAFDVFLAKGLSFGEQDLEHEEQGLVCQPFRVAAAIEMICAGEITDAATVATFGILRLRGLF